MLSFCLEIGQLRFVISALARILRHTEAAPSWCFRLLWKTISLIGSDPSRIRDYQHSIQTLLSSLSYQWRAQRQRQDRNKTVFVVDQVERSRLRTSYILAALQQPQRLTSARGFVARVLDRRNTPFEIAWQNAVFLAFYYTNHPFTFYVTHLPPITPDVGNETILFRIVLIMGTLDRLPDTMLGAGLVTTLWKTWTTNLRASFPYHAVVRAAVGSFVHQALKLHDDSLLLSCYRFSLQYSLSALGKPLPEPLMDVLVQDIIYVLESTELQLWQEISLSHTINPLQAPKVFAAILDHFIHQAVNLQMVEALLRYCNDRGIELPSRTILDLGKMYARQDMHKAIAFLSHSSLHNDDNCQLLMSIILAAHQQRITSLDKDDARLLAESMLNAGNLLATANPGRRQAIRYILALLLAAQQHRPVLNIIIARHHWDPFTFSNEYLLRFMRRFLKDRQPRLANQVYELVKTSPSFTKPQIHHFRSQLIIGLSQRGYYPLARQLSWRADNRGEYRTRAERILRLTRFKVHEPSVLKTVPLVRQLSQLDSSVSQSEIVKLYTLVVNSGRTRAKSLFSPPRPELLKLMSKEVCYS
jgi:hypothetical protein